MVCNGHKNSRRAAVRLIRRVAKPGAAIEQHAAIVGWCGWLVNTGEGCGTAWLQAEPAGVCCFALGQCPASVPWRDLGNKKAPCGAVLILA